MSEIHILSLWFENLISCNFVYPAHQPTNSGQTPAEADLNFLETARRCELYGIKMTLAKDHEGVPLNLAVAHMGIIVYQKFIRINTFSWAKIRKLSFKRRKFLVKLHPEGYVSIGVRATSYLRFFVPCVRQ